MASYWMRSARYLAARHLLRRRHLVARSSLFGLRFRFRTEDVVGRRIYKRGIHEALLTRYLLEEVRFGPADVVFDVGAHFGWYSLVLDRVLPKGALVHAVEPDPENFSLLEENLRLNGATRVVPNRCALSDEDGTGWLHRYPAKNMGRHSLLPLHNGERVAVRTTTLDTLRREEGLESRTPRLIKIDVEGFEHRVLRGARETLEHAELVVTEHAPTLLARANLDAGAPTALLAEIGFRPHLLGPAGPERVEPERLASHPDSVEVLWMRAPRSPRPSRGRVFLAGASAEGRERDAEQPAMDGAPGRPRLSVVMITKNEEERLSRTLESVSWAHEIVVVDSGSTDRTEEIARRYTDRFYVREWRGYSRQKQRALALASGDWVLSLDADEVVSPELRRSIEEALRNPGEVVGYELEMDTWMLGRWLGERGWHREWKLRLFRRDRGRFVDTLVHESVQVDGPRGRLEGKLLHYHDRGLHYELERINRYTTLGARQLYEEGRRARGLGTAIVRTFTYFFQAYVIRGGIAQGRAGLATAVLRGVYGFLKYAKLWEFGHRPPVDQEDASREEREAEPTHSRSRTRTGPS